ncbi:exopolysaccharide biosynthesis protein [Microvirga sp. KLBC 81]|uniref:sugar transferase n=1 Tax=Microvirga sp. KLBC 81 TaxID=1862707 RepID=UPI000D5237A4|nr:sugar transferase [Microvirga sp. KLBC 81]PVE21797.1 exopolysaccharide biosynthesis protein [Microvirga sp. KLBC 81]
MVFPKSFDASPSDASRTQERLPAKADRAVKGREHGPRPIGSYTKRALDLALVVPALIVLAPLFLMTLVLIACSIGTPVIYRHRRVGFNRQEFDCLKFRTMLPNSDEILRRHLENCPDARREWEQTRKLKNDPRITPVGAVLRKFSLDELPQLINVLRGEMSVVGPRPVVAQELAKYGANASSYLRARPGITGPWQISGRNDTTYGERVRLDTNYVSRWSLLTDIQIIIRTIPAVAFAKGSY